MPKGVSNKKVFKPYNPEQDVLFPHSIGQFIPANHPVRTISKVIDQLDLSGIYNSYSGGGASIYDPRMMLKLIIYAYFNNIYSCRAIARFIKESTHAMWLSGAQFPDYHTINAFRGKRIKDEIDNIFKDITKLLIKEGLLSLETVFIDGTKFESVANRYTFVWRKNVERGLENIEKKINTILKEINEIMQNDDKTIDLPEELKEVSSESILETAKQINQKLSGYFQDR
jgi:transposase